MAEASVMIVEDEVIVAEDLRRNLEASGYEVVGQALDGPEAVQMAGHLRPTVVLMDIFLKGNKDGICAARAIQRLIDTSIIYVSAHSSDSLISDAVQSGAAGYIVKPFQARQITSAVEIALHRRKEARRFEQGIEAVGSARPPEVSDDSPRSRNAADGGMPQAHYAALQRLQTLIADEDLWSALTNGTVHSAQQPLRITSRESEVIRWLLCYRRPTQVAEVMGISVNTARKHLKSVFRKLNVHSQDELIRFLLDGVWAPSTTAPLCH
jgi:DNA-binding NarL/FixJ family response regulator